MQFGIYYPRYYFVFLIVLYSAVLLCGEFELETSEFYDRLAIRLDINTYPGSLSFFKPTFIAQALDVCLIEKAQVRNNGKTITGVVSISPFLFRLKLRGFIITLQHLEVERVTIYKQHYEEEDFIIDSQHKLVSYELQPSFASFPQSYFLDNDDTPNITHKLEKKPGTSGNILMPE
jgi:hypothetical protein